jgi:Zn-dependent peptidase ImmA (M78 family)/DNA-binding XRE family transcriptional regulator
MHTMAAVKIPSLAKADLLVWARESAGFTQEELAKKIPVKTEKLVAWENGSAKPTMGQLRKLAQAVKRPIAVFYLPEKPLDFQPLKDFRLLPSTLHDWESPKLRFEIRQTEYRRELAIELKELIGESLKSIPVRIGQSDEPREVARRIRNYLGISFEEQKQHAQPYDALAFWKRAIESQDILVFQFSGVDIKESRGFSIGKFPLPVIAVNTKDTPRGRIFTILHELVHILLHETGICDLSESRRKAPEERAVEIFCNQVAAEVLVPTELLSQTEQYRGILVESGWNDQALSSLSQVFGASQETILRRLLSLNRISEDYYRAKRRDFLEQYEASATGSGGFVPPAKKVLSYAGISFTDLVLSSYYQNKITSSDVSSYLGVKLNHLPQIESLLWKAPLTGRAANVQY